MVSRLHSLLLPLLFGLGIVFLHAYNITDIPAGLYLDETSIGLNAAQISETLTDEKGVFLPLYFEAFGEWKNPLYIYTSAIFMKVMGISEWSLRITSIFFYALFLWGIWAVSRQLFPKEPSVSWYAMLAAGTLPWFFTLSRISFEVISQITTAVWFLFFAFRAYSPETKIQQSLYSAIYAGGILALFLYSYSTSKVLAFGTILALGIAFPSREYWKTHSTLISSFLFCIIPYILFSFSHPGALSSRFEILTYLYQENLSTLEKMSIFLRNYASAFDLSSFQLFQGDPNLRHSSGYMGQFFIIPFALAMSGIGNLCISIFQKNIFLNRWKLFILFLLLGAGVPAALTTDTHHSLRLLFLGFILFLCSLYGYKSLTQVLGKWKQAGMIIVFGGIVLQSWFYFHDYFSEYQKRSIGYFGGHKYQEKVEWAYNQNPENIIMYEQKNSPFYASVEFYNMVLNTDVIMNQLPIQQNNCYIWSIWNPPQTNISPTARAEKTSDDIFEAACY